MVPEKGTLNDVIDYLTIALKLGFEDLKVYYIRASAHFFNHNFGLAMEDINIAINMIKNEPYILADCLSLRVVTLQKMGNFKEAYDDLIEITKIEKIGSGHFWLWLSGVNSLREEIYQRTAFEWKLQSTEKDVGIYKFILTLMILNESMPKYMLGKDGKPHEYHRGNVIEKEMPYMVPTLKEIIGDDIWQAAKRGKKFQASFSLETDS